MVDEPLSPLAERVLERIAAIERRKRVLRTGATASLITASLVAYWALRDEEVPVPAVPVASRDVEAGSSPRTADDSPSDAVPDAAVLDAFDEGGGAAALRALQDLLGDEQLQHAIDGLAAEGIGRVARSSPARQRVAVLEAIAASPADTRARMAGVVLAGLDDPEDAVRSAAIRTLVRCFPGGASHPVLDRVLEERGLHGGEDERYAVAAALSDPRFRHLAGTLERALADPSARVRSRAAASLGPVGASDSVAALRPLLEDEELDVRVAAARSLGLLGDESGDAFLRETLEHPDPMWRVAALGFLADVGDPLAIEAAHDFLERGDEWMKVEALRVLAEAQEPVERRFLEPALASANDDLRVAAGRVLLRDVGPFGRAVA
ncbi:MAG: HEAT repeat domain-containing protein, partial [Planctomycetota bacterium JB042]